MFYKSLKLNVYRITKYFILQVRVMEKHLKGGENIAVFTHRNIVIE